MTGVGVKRVGAVATVTLDQPNKLNALDRPTRWELINALRGVSADMAVRAVILTANGRAFCVGQDLSAVDELDHADETVAGSYNPIALAIARMPKPVIAAINGATVGAGLGLALACDLRLAATSATFSCGFAKVGLVPDTGVSWHLVRELGYARAFALATLGRTFSAEEARGFGLVNRVLPAEDLAAGADELAGMMAAGPAQALALTKSQFRAMGEISFEAALGLEARHQGDAASHPDHIEGRTAFVERRAPRWG